jgi:hypothetical protein
LGIKETYRKQLKEQKTSPFGANVGLTCDVKKLDKEFPAEFWYSKGESAAGSANRSKEEQGKRKQTILFESIVASKIKKNLSTSARREQSDEVLRNTQANSSISAAPARPPVSGSGGAGQQRVNFLVDALYTQPRR